MIKETYNKTKIVATIGPASSSREMLIKLIEKGVDVCRINMSHGDHDIHQEAINNIREIADKCEIAVAILIDLQGPKLRIGKVENDIIELESNTQIEVTSKKVLCTEKMLSVSYKRLAEDLVKGDRILLDDGKVELKVVSIKKNGNILADVIIGGPLTSSKGFNLPDSNLKVETLTKKDKRDLEFALKNNIEWIGFSFVREASDIIQLKNLIKKENDFTGVIAKIEKPEAVDNFDEILAVSDGIMVARGDLGVEVPLERVPLIQKQIVKSCMEHSKPVIIATQMMESMITNSYPTRAEVNDVANAVLDGADAVMLSAETSVGHAPDRVVEIMESIIKSTESFRLTKNKAFKPRKESDTYMADELCYTAVKFSNQIGAKAIVAMTQSGYTGYQVSSYRPETDIFIFTGNKPLLCKLNLVWGVRGFFYNKMSSTDKTIEDIIEVLKEKGHIEKDDKVVHLASMPIIDKLRTNMLKVSIID